MNDILTLILLIFLLLVLFLYRRHINSTSSTPEEPELTPKVEHVAIVDPTQMQQIIDQSRQAVATSQEQFNAYLQDLSSKAENSFAQDEQTVKAQVNKLLETFEDNLSNFLTATQTQSTKAVELEIQSARSLIESYKKQQFSLIDENIVAMLEKTLSLVLTKKLSLEDQIDLIYESLEKAKADKFII